MHRESPRSGRGVPATVSALRNLYVTIDSIGTTYRDRLNEECREPFVVLLVDILAFLIRSNADLYHGRTRAAYAGEGVQSERRLFSSFISPRGEPNSFIEVLRRFSGASLRAQAPRLEELSLIARQHVTNDFANPDPSTEIVLRNLQILARGKSIVCRAHASFLRVLTVRRCQSMIQLSPDASQ